MSSYLNTCQVENKSIGDLAVVITIIVTMMPSRRKLAGVHFQRAGKTCFRNVPMIAFFLLAVIVKALPPLTCYFFDEFITTQHKLQDSEDGIHPAIP